MQIHTLFAKKLIGKIDDIEFPNLGMNITQGQPLFIIKQGKRSIQFNSPISGQVAKVNNDLGDNIDALDYSPYEKNWICVIDADKLDTELSRLKIGKNAVNFYQDEIEKYTKQIKNLISKDVDKKDNFELYWGQLEKLEEKEWYLVTSEFFKK